MALPASGPISSSQIANELSDPAPVSLREMSSTAGFSTPDAMSDFYGYGNTYNEFYYYNVGQKNESFACSFDTNAQAFHDGDSALPTSGDHLFDGEDPATASPLNLTQGQYYGINVDTNTQSSAAMLIKVGDANEVEGIALCP